MSYRQKQNKTKNPNKKKLLLQFCLPTMSSKIEPNNNNKKFPRKDANWQDASCENCGGWGRDVEFKCHVDKSIRLNSLGQ